jgi:hypothetical protein
MQTNEPKGEHDKDRLSLNPDPVLTELDAERR